ncbi:transcriptional regulator family: Fungal Specific TF [Agaricus bisporus var. burnettii]|uniref:Transcriptional regulator family: Fungal Specific TF n=1 Tax=Agaricus bisporus var. burnettii TaxID=192524 RepID=A0A8H7F9W6_AGABI|nr:transcriptional regulator family: Fungal Specific TF [Agaricus bisporus var. burnettii]
MPAVGKDKGKQQKPRKKPGRVPTSCAECRRLKLRCDRNIPCEKCVSRGCGSICPDGALTPGKNNRMILANTDELHDRIDHLTSHIRELEGALRTLQASVSNDPHPLLQKELFHDLPPLSVPLRSSTSSSGDPIPSSEEIFTIPSPKTSTNAPMDPDPTAHSDFCGTLSLSEHGQSSFFGSTARLEFLAQRTPKAETKPARLSHELFDFACNEYRPAEDRLTKEISRLLPPRSEASRLCEVYLHYGEVMYSPLTRLELFDETWAAADQVQSSPELRQPETLALLFMVFAISGHFDHKRRSNNNDSNEYYYLAKACLRLASRHENTLAYLQTLIHMSQYLHFSGGESASPDGRWECLCQAVRISYKMGLHLHGIRWNMPSDLAERRSRIFCEIFLLDTWTSFYSGRPPMVSLAFMDRTTPTDYDEGTDAEGNKKPGFHVWTYKYAVLLHSVMAIAFGPRPPPYSSILDLDLKIRNFPVPAQWRPVCDPESPPPPPEIHMARFLVSFAKESTLLNLHRSYFMSALEQSPDDLAKHTFIPSVLAIYRSAWRLIRNLRYIWKAVPDLVSKVNVAWSQALSSAVVMCLFVTRTPSSPLTDPALDELDSLVELFQEAIETCEAAKDLLNDLRSLRMYARQSAGRSYEQEGYPLTSSDLDRLSGKTYVLTPPPPPPTSTLISQQQQQHRHTPSCHQPGSSYTHTSSTIKRDPSPTQSSATVLSDLSPSAPFGSTATLSTSSQPFPTPTAYDYTLPPSHSHIPPSYTHHTSQTHLTPQPQPHPIILQDIRDFTTRGIPASHSITHYFDFAPEGSESINSIIGHPLSTSSRQQRPQQRRQSMPSYHTYSDFGIYPTSFETSFHLDYAPHQPRSPFSAVNFSTATGTTDSSFQELAQQLGFH